MSCEIVVLALSRQCWYMLIPDGPIVSIAQQVRPSSLSEILCLIDDGWVYRCAVPEEWTVLLHLMKQMLNWLTSTKLELLRLSSLRTQICCSLAAKR